MTRPPIQPPPPPQRASKRFDVFEFNEEDERVEKASGRFIGKLGNPNKFKKEDSPLDKYKFLQCFVAPGTINQQKEIRSEPIDVDDEEVMETPQKKITDRVIDADDSEVMETLQKEISDGVIDVDDSGSGHCRVRSVSDPRGMSREEGAFEMESFGLDAILLSNSSKHENESVDMISDGDDNTEMSSSSTSTLSLICFGVSSEERLQERGSVGHEIDIVNMTVVVFPDFILYGDIYCTESRLTFSCSCIKVEGSIVNGTKGSFNSEWTIGDVISIESQWCGRVETAVINLILKSKDSTGAGNAKETSGSNLEMPCSSLQPLTGIELLRFAVYDPNWLEGQEAIKSLDVRYKDLWNIIFDTDKENEDNAFLGQQSKLHSMCYFNEFEGPFEDVIFPKGDPDAVIIRKRDAKLLLPERFINDTIIDFYIKYLKSKIQPQDQHRFHFFNSFFFRKLADLDNPSSACEGRAAFQRVHKWTRKVNLFEKDYIFIPVNYSLHWSLIVICHPGEVAHLKDAEIEISPKVPCILHMDSIEGSHRGLKNLVRSYLCEEWKERHKETVDDVSSKYLQLRFVPLELPQQENSSDCGLFLLHFVERFLEEAPINFSPFKITKLSKFLNRNWFPPAEASAKRDHILKLIFEISTEYSQKVQSSDCVHNLASSHLAETCHGYPADSNPQQAIASSPFGASPSRVVERTRELGMFTKLLERGIRPRSLSDGNNQQTAAPHQRIVMSPIEEVEETGEQITESPSDIEVCRQVADLKSESPSGEFRLFGTSLKLPFSLHLDEQDETDSIYGTSISGSLQSSESGVDENPLLTENKTCESESSSTSIEVLAPFVEDSQESISMHDGNESKASPFLRGQIHASSHQEADSTENINLQESNMPMSKDDPMLEADEQHQVQKRRRIMSAGGGRQLKRRLLEESH